MATITEATAGRVRAAMDAAERSKKWTAEKAGIPIATFMRKAQGHRDFTLTELSKIAAALTVEPSALIPDEFAHDKAEVA